MIKAVIISGLLFVIGNIAWPLFNEQKVLYIPQAVFFISLLTYCKMNVSADKKFTHLFLMYLLLLSYGNLVKQVFYTDTIKQVNDYIWGALVTAWLLFKLKNKLKWQTRNTQYGRR